MIFLPRKLVEYYSYVNPENIQILKHRFPIEKKILYAE